MTVSPVAQLQARADGRAFAAILRVGDELEIVGDEGFLQELLGSGVRAVVHDQDFLVNGYAAHPIQQVGQRGSLVVNWNDDG